MISKEEMSKTVCSSNMLLFDDGSSMETSSSVRHAASPDPYKKALAILRYWTIKLQLAVEQFNFTRNKLIVKAKNSLKFRDPPLPRTDAIDKLKQLKKIVEEVQKQYERAEADVLAAKPIQMTRAEEADAHIVTCIEEFISEVGQIEI